MRARWLASIVGLLAVGCIDSMSVGLSPLATLDASAVSEPEAGPSDAGARLEAGAIAREASVDAATPDATARDAAPGAATDAAPDAASDAATDAATDADSAQPDAGRERCPEALCAIAGIAPKDNVCPNGEQSACLREESGQCAWYCL